jgi:hypothetical protein
MLLLKTAALLYLTTFKLISNLINVNKLIINAFTLVIIMLISAILLDFIICFNY